MFSPCWGVEGEGVSQLSCSWRLGFDFPRYSAYRLEEDLGLKFRDWKHIL